MQLQTDCVPMGYFATPLSWLRACFKQVEEGKLSRLQDTAAAKSNRLDTQRQRLQELHTTLTSAQQELKELQGTVAEKQKEANAAGSEQRKIG